MKMKIIVGAIASDGVYYNEAQSIWRQFMDVHPSVTSFFIKGTSEGTTKEDLQTFTCDIPETFENIFKKTIEFMKFALMHNNEWVFLLRTNVSSLFHWDNVLAMLEENAEYDVVANKKYHGYICFPTGCGMFLSRKVVEAICNVPEEQLDTLAKRYNDDVILGILIQTLGFASNFKDVGYNHIHETTLIDSTSCHLRCRIDNATDETRRQIEIPMMHKWIQHWYPKINRNREIL